MNMILREEQYERIARWLDGETVDLTSDEQAAAREMRERENLLSERLDVHAAPEVFARIERRVGAELARPRVRWVWAGAAVAAAAAVVLAALWFLRTEDVSPTPAPGGGLAHATHQELFAALHASTDAGELDLVDRDLSELEADVLVIQAATAEDLRLKALEREIEEFWLDHSPTLKPIEG
ncbi:MAG TPA: hypothetical protein DCX07_13850 [Phycisphaerales bacterium]|nr:hypothetical protein [Phycisphaerales bacterium]